MQFLGGFWRIWHVGARRAAVRYPGTLPVLQAVRSCVIVLLLGSSLISVRPVRVSRPIKMQDGPAKTRTENEQSLRCCMQKGEGGRPRPPSHNTRSQRTISRSSSIYQHAKLALSLHTGFGFLVLRFACPSLCCGWDGWALLIALLAP